MHSYFSTFISATFAWYFDILNQFGLVGVTVLMAMESSIFPVPSEMVVPPAAVVYLDDPHRDAAVVNVLLVIAAGTLGSYIGASVTYWVARLLGRPLVLKFGKYIFLTEKKLQHADEWIARYGASGIFMARLLPVVRHVISIPAGIMGMRFSTFSVMTIVGSLLWCSVLAIFGVLMRDEMLMLVKYRGAIPAGELAQVHDAFNKITLATLALVSVALASYYLLARCKAGMRHEKHAVETPATPLLPK